MKREKPPSLASFYLSRFWHSPATQAIVSATIFLVAIIALLIVDVYHTARRLCTAAGHSHSFWNLFPHIFSRGPRDYHYRRSIGKMVKIHLEDAILIGLYLLLLPVLFVLFVLWVAQYYIARLCGRALDRDGIMNDWKESVGNARGGGLATSLIGPGTDRKLEFYNKSTI
ncbi:hypothetical protein FIE12Z_8099 [Fusarium flagelliforme]|uniref:Uncharacterized protein n=1 Tax=Fusarium flagelliforme TaxID=2675880 RepID=A0A395MIA2_9HYPO|nr:hypothetical protein FIE12Z_8099 [Fusarium flagelliforme]